MGGRQAEENTEEKQEGWENFAGQAEVKKKIVGDSVAWWAGASCGRVSKQLPFPSFPHLEIISTGVCCGLSCCLFVLFLFA